MEIKLQVRRAVESDLPAIHSIETKCFPDPWSLQMLTDEMKLSAISTYLIAEIGEMPVGFLSVRSMLDELHVTSIAVLEDFRRIGIAKIMMTHMIEFAKKQDFVGMTLECRVSNHSAIALYQSLGFVESGIRKGYYADGEDAKIMWLHFSKIVLAIESSCDETSCAVLRGGREVLSNEIYSQIDLHEVYGGVVPEIASRNHLEKIGDVVQHALNKAGIGYSDIDLVAVTKGPGLVGALLVGLSYAKGLAYSLGKPLVGVHHIEGHIAANYIAHQGLKPPFLCLVVSGGHTHLIDVKGYTKFEVIGRTLDDAVGEAYDKVARVMGLGYPGGPVVDRLAKQGTANIAFPRAKRNDDDLDFSFSGLKTAVLNHINSLRQKSEELPVADICASFQEAVMDVLRHKVEKALAQKGYKNFALAGGVAANSRLREVMVFEGVETYYPPLSLCTDNAAMIGSIAYFYHREGYESPLDLNASPTIKIGAHT